MPLDTTSRSLPNVTTGPVLRRPGKILLGMLGQFASRCYLEVDKCGWITALLLDARALEIDYGCCLFLYPEPLDDVKELGPQLKTIRF